MLVYIYGSCVSRDAFEFPEAPYLAGYNARSTLGSAFGVAIDREKLPDFDIANNPSRFQQRMVSSDVNKLLANELATTDFDVLLMDFIDERFNLIPVGDGFVTCSPEAIRCGLPRRHPHEVAFGSREHIEMFAASWKRLLEVVPPEKIVINRVYWAGMDSDANAVEDPEVVARSNRILDTLYDIAAQVEGVRFIEYSDDSFVADGKHKWGRSPFHFVGQFYKKTLSALAELERYAEDSYFDGAPRPSIDGSVAYQLAGRTIESNYFLSCDAHSVNMPDAIHLDESFVYSAGDVTTVEGLLTTTFAGGAGDYVLTVRLPEVQEQQNGYGARFALDGWDSVTYVAIGAVINNVFKHVKLVRPIQGSWIDFSVSFDDLLYKIQNGFSSPEDLARFGEVRVFVKGAPSSSGAVVSLDWCGVWKESPRSDVRDGRIEEKGRSVVSILRKYLWDNAPNVSDDVSLFIEDGEFRVPGNKSLLWALERDMPDELHLVGTYRYIWHSLVFAANCLTYAEQKHDMRAMYAGKDMVDKWIEQNLYSESADLRYAWYDHGTAERLAAMLVVFEAGTRAEFDRRFMQRLSKAIYEHCLLLESEAFYAANQSTRFHNHAWFQDLALIAGGIVVDAGVASSRWIETGISRMYGQIDELVIRDCGFSVFAENSSGYHDAAVAILEVVGEFSSIAGFGDRISSVATDMQKWSRYFRYSDGRRPSNGDTLRRGNGEAGRQESRLSHEDSIVVLPRAGYGVVKGRQGEDPYMFALLATSRSGTHKHADDLSFCLEFDGIEWFTDPGFYSHDYEDRIPRYLRGPWAHNGIVIRGLDYSLEPGSSMIRGVGVASDFAISGEHRCYKDILVRRTVRGDVRVLALSFTDEVVAQFLPGDLVSSYTVLHLGETVDVEKLPGSVVLSSVHSSSELIVEFDSGYDVIVGDGGSPDVMSLAGTGFHHANPTNTILVHHEFGRALSWTVSARPKVGPK